MFGIRQRLRYFHAASWALVDRFIHDVRGVNAVEFALVAPMLVGLYIGSAETALGVSINRKVSRVSSTVSDLIAQSQAITAEDIDATMNAAYGIMAPMSQEKINKLRIVVTGVDIDANKNTKVLWSRAKGAGATAAALNSSYSIPSNIKIANTFIVVAHVQYDYTPNLGGNITGSINFDKKNYLRPRIGSSVTCSNC